MRTKLVGLLVLAGLLIPALPSLAGNELFRAGVLSCSATSRAVTSLSVFGCNGGVNQAKGEMFGACQGSYISRRVSVPFTVSGYMRETGRPFPDNDRALRFDYRGIRCEVNTWRLRSVQNCKSIEGGSGMACDVCIMLGGRRCYNARLVVTASE
jgi:hypothetical protein